MSYVQDALGIFSSLLIIRKDSEIRKLSLYIKNNINFYKFLIKTPEKLSLYSSIKQNGPFNGLKNFKKDIINIKYKSLDNIFFDYKYFFSYCRSKYSESTILFLLNMKIKIHGIIDDNEKFLGTKFLNYKTINSKVFIKRYKNKLKDCAIIISHQRESTSIKIIKNLLKLGLKKEQIKVIKY